MSTSLSPAHTTLLEKIPLAPGSNIATRAVEYEADGVTFEGYLAFDDSTDEQRPAVMVVHDWLGISEYTEVRCQMLARLGYIAFAADIYGRGVRPQGGEAAAEAGRFYGDPALMRARVVAGLTELLSQPLVDPHHVAVIGYCFGGSVALALAATGADIAGVVTFHAGLAPLSPGDAAGIKAKILVLSGAADPVVPDEAVSAFENSLRVAPQVDWQVTRYAGAMHAFTLPEADAPDHGAKYDPRAERRSWTAMRNFLDEIFAGEPR